MNSVFDFSLETMHSGKILKPLIVFLWSCSNLFKFVFSCCCLNVKWVLIAVFHIYATLHTYDRISDLSMVFHVIVVICIKFYYFIIDCSKSPIIDNIIVYVIRIGYDVYQMAMYSFFSIQYFEIII